MLSETYEVIVAVNGREAVEMYDRFKADVVLMDIAMPEMDGVQATIEIIKKGSKCRYSLCNCFCFLQR